MNTKELISRHIIWKDEFFINKWYRACPNCNEVIECDGKTFLRRALRDYAKPCRSCTNRRPHTNETKQKLSLLRKGKNKGKDNSFYGKNHTEESKEKMSLSHKGILPHNKGKKLTDSHKNKISISHIGITLSIASRKKLSESSKKSWKISEIRKKRLSTNRWNNVSCDKGQLEFIQKWNKLGFNFIPNYRIKDDSNLFYLDGYDKDKNIVLEYDSKYHNTTAQKQNDLLRQKKIIEILKPRKFWRYNSIDKKIKNIPTD